MVMCALNSAQSVSLYVHILMAIDCDILIV